MRVRRTLARWMILGLALAAIATIAGPIVTSTEHNRTYIPFAPRDATEVCGTVTGSQTWGPENATYVVICDVTIAPGASLTIARGVQVRFNAGTALTVRGTLVAVGDLADVIHFTANTDSPTPGFWNGLTIEGSSGQAQLAYVSISYGGGGANEANLFVAGGQFTLDDSTISFSEHDGLGGTAGAFTVEDSAITDNLRWGINTKARICPCPPEPYPPQDGVDYTVSGSRIGDNGAGGVHTY